VQIQKSCRQPRSTKNQIGQNEGKDENTRGWMDMQENPENNSPVFWGGQARNAMRKLTWERGKGRGERFGKEKACPKGEPPELKLGENRTGS